MSGWRASDGWAIDRAAPVRFSFDGLKVDGYQGDTLASALLANGVQTVGRSFKYHRPRGFWGRASKIRMASPIFAARSIDRMCR
ncbi:2Fe-2S iron-sulfur cluster-binding protein [Mesorhizobium sp. DCY119]|uniref:2Fe-2S iron-sulfur cluster-binding protein n=1 Tax=Mesorhizobium sp. DCY119 TaxID=2108445 RepID=UPI001FE1ED68|nr:2Fe-2S iron-sulfur cluster-binding protein [Mesorhizobium sp. DCY119]